MAANNFKIKNGANLQPTTQAASVAGDLRVDSAASNALKYYDTAERTVANLDGSQVLTNKTLTSPVLTTPTVDVATMTEQGSTPATPSAGSAKFYAKADGMYRLDSAGAETKIGAGVGGINYILNPDAETNTTGWTTYADAAAATPADGTGGSPNVTIARTTSGPLRGTGSFRLAKGAANRQGEGVAYRITLNEADKAKPITISFDYRVSSNFVPGTDSTVGDVTVYVYDVTNATLLQPTPYKIVGGSSGTHRYSANFQTSSSSIDYRIIFHVSGTTATAWDFDFDNVVVGPQVQVYGSPVTDWSAAVTPTVTGLGTGSSTPTLKWRRVGDSMHGWVQITKDASGGSGGANVGFTLPFGSIDTTKNIGVNAIVGVGDNDGASTYITTLTGSSTTALFFAIPGSSFAANKTLEGHFTIPLTGWGSNVLMSQDTDTRVVAARALTPVGTFTSGSPIAFGTVGFDTHAGYSTSTGEYTVPVAGYYSVHGWVDTTAAGRNIVVAVNGVTASIAGLTNSSAICNFSTIVRAKAGDLLSVEDSSGSQTTSVGTLCIERISGPATIAANEIVAARYLSGAGQTSNDTTTDIVQYNTKDFDTHGAVTTGASWKFTAPATGYYDVSMGLVSESTTATAVVFVDLYKNGSAHQTLSRNQKNGATSCPYQLYGTGLIYLLESEYIDIRVANSSGGTRTFLSNANANWVAIRRRN